MERTGWAGIMQETPSRFLQNMDQKLFSTKPHIWDENMRVMLAETIGRNYPVEAVAVKSQKRRSGECGIEIIDTKKPRVESSII